MFGRSKDTDDGRGTTIVNFGGFYKFTPDFNLLFSAGHSVSGEKHTVAYLGLWWTWGGGNETEHQAGPTRQNHWALLSR